MQSKLHLGPITQIHMKYQFSNTKWNVHCITRIHVHCKLHYLTHVTSRSPSLSMSKTLYMYLLEQKGHNISHVYTDNFIFYYVMLLSLNISITCTLYKAIYTGWWYMCNCVHYECCSCT